MPRKRRREDIRALRRQREAIRSGHLEIPLSFEELVEEGVQELEEPRPSSPPVSVEP